MEIIRRDSDYAIRCLIYLARLDPRRVEPVGQIAELEGLPEPLLRKIMQKLSRAGLVQSVRGVHGGFRLKKDPAAINILMILQAVQGEVVFSRCLLPNECCPNSGVCQLHAGLHRIQDGLTAMLAKTTLLALATGNAEDEAPGATEGSMAAK